MAPRLLRPLGEKGFALLWVGQTVSRLGDGAFQAVLTWTVYAITGSTAGEPIWQSLGQELIPANYLSRVYSLDMLGSFALLPVGFALSGIVAAAVGVRPTLIGAGSICAGVTLLGLCTPVIRKLH